VRTMAEVFVYECAACDAQFSLLQLDPPPAIECCISCQAQGARLIDRAGEQVGSLHRFSKHPQIIDGPSDK